MIKDIRNAFLTFPQTQFLQGHFFVTSAEISSFESREASAAVMSMFWECTCAEISSQS